MTFESTHKSKTLKTISNKTNIKKKSIKLNNYDTQIKSAKMHYIFHTSFMLFLRNFYSSVITTTSVVFSSCDELYVFTPESNVIIKRRIFSLKEITLSITVGSLNNLRFVYFVNFACR